MRITLILLLFLAELTSALAQVNARLFQDPDVSENHITFVYAGDIWVAPKSGGTAFKLSSPAGEETMPRFSPDGSRIAFSGNYNGNTALYVVASMGGLPARLTYHAHTDRMLDWSPDGQRVLFVSSRNSGRQRFDQLYTIPVSGGQARLLPMPYGERGTFSPDGSRMAYTPISRLNRSWKRYRGGMAADIFLFDLDTYASENITDHIANDEAPMWHGNHIYFLSDRGSEQRYNIWRYDLDSKQTRQITRFSDFDVNSPAIGPDAIVFEAAGKLHLLDLATDQYKEVDIRVVTDNKSLAPRTEKVADNIQDAHLSPDGKRVVVQARGELFSLPAEHGYVKNMSRTSGTAERYPAWSPDGRYIAYWSDHTGEYQLMIRDLKNGGREEKLTNYGPGFRYKPHWSPDSKKIAFIDESMTIHLFDMEGRTSKAIDQSELFLSHGGLQNFHFDWSADSRWLTYALPTGNNNRIIHLYELETGQVNQATSGFYSDSQPVFDPEGKYLYFFTNRHFSPVYSDFDNSFVYPNATQVAAVALRKEVPSPLAPRNDELDSEEEKENGDESKEEDGEEEAIRIDFDGFEQRVVLLPPDPGNYVKLSAASGKVIYHRIPDSGSDDRQKPVVYYDLNERKASSLRPTITN